MQVTHQDSFVQKFHGNADLGKIQQRLQSGSGGWLDSQFLTLKKSVFQWKSFMVLNQLSAHGEKKNFTSRNAFLGSGAHVYSGFGE
jgi:hypothetical protein